MGQYLRFSICSKYIFIYFQAQAKGYKGFGPKEADKNERHFTDEQLKAGQGVIGLQMGSNKGATQAGQSFGKSRMIVD